jgi:hypothetical protein
MIGDVGLGLDTVALRALLAIRAQELGMGLSLVEVINSPLDVVLDKVAQMDTSTPYIGVSPSPPAPPAPPSTIYVPILVPVVDTPSPSDDRSAVFVAVIVLLSLLAVLVLGYVCVDNWPVYQRVPVIPIKHVSKTREFRWVTELPTAPPLNPPFNPSADRPVWWRM